MYSNEDYLLELLQESGYIGQEDVEEATNAARGKHTIVEALLDDLQDSLRPAVPAG